MPALRRRARAGDSAALFGSRNGAAFAGQLPSTCVMRSAAMTTRWPKGDQSPDDLKTQAADISKRQLGRLGLETTVTDRALLANAAVRQSGADDPIGGPLCPVSLQIFADAAAAEDGGS
jgi:hypothetical protein